MLPTSTKVAGPETPPGGLRLLCRLAKPKNGLNFGLFEKHVKCFFQRFRAPKCLRINNHFLYVDTEEVS